jgi:O-antigen/teichoic acid export membrane protein
MFGINIFIGRLLGPEEYGKYNATLSLATAISVFIVAGMDVSSIRFIADKKYSKFKKNIFTTTLTVVVLNLFFVAILFLMIGFSIQEMLFKTNTTREYWPVVIVLFFAGAISLKTVFNGFLRAFQQIKEQSVLKFLDAIMVAVLIVIFFILMKKRENVFYVWSVIGGGIFFSSGAFMLLRGYFGRLNFKLFKKIFLIYNRFVLVSTFMGALLFLDKFLIGKFIGMRELGIYSAYYTASHGVISELSGILMNVLWPSVIENKNHLSEIVKKTNKIFIIFFIPIILTIIGITTLFFSFYGQNFSFQWRYICLFSINTFMGMLFSLYLSYLNIQHIKKGVIIQSFLFVGVSLFTLIIFKNIFVYLIVQIITQILLTVYISFFLLGKFKKNC